MAFNSQTQVFKLCVHLQSVGYKMNKLMGKESLKNKCEKNKCELLSESKIKSPQ